MQVAKYWRNRRLRYRLLRAKRSAAQDRQRPAPNGSERAPLARQAETRLREIA